MPYLLTIVFAFMSPDDASVGPHSHYLEVDRFDSLAQCVEEGRHLMRVADEFESLEFSCDRAQAQH